MLPPDHANGPSPERSGTRLRARGAGRAAGDGRCGAHSPTPPLRRRHRAFLVESWSEQNCRDANVHTWLMPCVAHR